MGWKDIGKKGNGLPFMDFEENKPKRIRFVGANSVPDIASIAQYADGPVEAWSHWTPDELGEKIGGNKMVVCCGVRKGCIFHQEPLKWKSKGDYFVNAIEYIAADAKKGTYEGRKMRLFKGGIQIFEQIITQANNVGVDPDAVDWIISKTGTKRDTKWTAVMVTQVLDKAIDIMEFDALEEFPEFQDESIPALIDYTKLDAFKVMTPAEQSAWYENLLKEPENNEDPAEAEPPAAPAGASGTTTVAAPTAGKIAMPGRGRRPAAAAPAAAPAAKAPAPPAKGPSVAQVAYTAACGVPDPWGVKLSESDNIDFIVEKGVDEEFQITQELLDAAKLVKAGPPAAAPAAPPRPAAPPTPAAAAAPAGDAEALQAELLKHTKSSAYLKNFVNMKAFLKHLAADAKAVGKIEDIALLSSLIELCEQGEDAIQTAVEEAKAA